MQLASPFLLSKETGGGASLPRGDSTNRAEHLGVILTFYFFLTSVDPLPGNSLLQSLHLLISFFPNTAMSPSLFLGESVVPSRFVPPLRWHPFSEGDLIVLLLTNLCYPMCQRILKIVNDCMRIYNEKICTMVENV